MPLTKLKILFPVLSLNAIVVQFSNSRSDFEPVFHVQPNLLHNVVKGKKKTGRENGIWNIFEKWNIFLRNKEAMAIGRYFAPSHSCDKKRRKRRGKKFPLCEIMSKCYENIEKAKYSPEESLRNEFLQRRVPK